MPNITAYDSCGFFTLNSYVNSSHVSSKHYDEEVMYDNTVTHNVVTLCGYIPGIGIFIGGLRAYVNICVDFEGDFSTRVVAVVRGIFEILGIGLLFLIVDLIITLHRHCFTQISNKQNA